MKLKDVLFAAILPFLIGATWVIDLGDDHVYVLTDGYPNCIKPTGPTGQLKSHTIPTLTTGRLGIGDLTGNGQFEYIVSNRNQISAYDLCDGLLWTQPASTNWDVCPVGSSASEECHAYWPWTSYGIVFQGKFLHIGADWRTLYVRDGRTGKIIKTVNLGVGKWMYVVASEDKVFVTQAPAHLQVKALNSNFEVAWTRDHGFIQNRYAPPQVGDINGDGVKDIVHSTLALNGINGNLIWKKNFNDRAIIGTQTFNIMPYGLVVYSMYQPINSSHPSLTTVRPNGTEILNYLNGKHAHQHTVGNFITGCGESSVLARHGDGVSHWLSCNGVNIKTNLRKDPGWGGDGELVHRIEWDGLPGDEVLYAQRHVDYDKIPLLRIVNANATQFLTPVFHGGHDPDPTLYYRSTNSWYGWTNRGSGPNDDGPYEDGAWVINAFGDCRDEIVTIKPKEIVIYYGSGRACAASKFDTPPITTQVYNPR